MKMKINTESAIFRKKYKILLLAVETKTPSFVNFIIPVYAAVPVVSLLPRLLSVIASSYYRRKQRRNRKRGK
jgi:hypothetical protein